MDPLNRLAGNALSRVARLAGIGGDLTLGAGMAAAVAWNAKVTAHADRTWPVGLGVGIVICVIALLRRRNPAWAAVAGFALFTAAAVPAARFAGKDRVEPLMSALGSIETAGTDTLAAIRQLAGLLRDPGEVSVPAGLESISQLAERFAAHGPAVDLRLPVSCQRRAGHLM